MIEILLLFIITLSSSKKIPTIELGVNTTFDSISNELEFIYNGPGKDIILIYVKFEGEYYDYEFDCTYSHSTGEGTSSEIVLYSNNQVGKTGSCNIKFFLSNDSDKGSLIIYTLNKVLSIKLKNQYGHLDNEFFQIFKGIEPSVSQLTFLVPSLEKDITANFEYQKKENLNDIYYDIDNPFIVCHGKTCQDNITSYDFKKKESYKIMIKIHRVKNKNTDYIGIPGFRFYDINYNGTYSPDDIVNDSSLLKIHFLLISLILLIL